MGINSRCYTLRLSAAMVRRLDELRGQFPTLPQSLLAKCILSSVLERPLEERVKIIERQLRRPPLKE